MNSHPWGHKAVPISTRKKQLFGQRRQSRSRPLLVASTLIVSIAVVFAVGFKFGRYFNGDPVGGNGLLAANVDNQGNLAERTVSE